MMCCLAACVVPYTFRKQCSVTLPQFFMVLAHTGSLHKQNSLFLFTLVTFPHGVLRIHGFKRAKAVVVGKTCGLTLLRLCSYNIVVPRLTTLIRSSEIAVEPKRRKVKLKNPLKHIKTRLMCSNGLKTHRPAKILHTAAIFGACIVRNPALSTAGSHFEHPWPF